MTQQEFVRHYFHLFRGLIYDGIRRREGPEWSIWQERVCDPKLEEYLLQAYAEVAKTFEKPTPTPAPQRPAPPTHQPNQRK